MDQIFSVASIFKFKGISLLLAGVVVFWIAFRPSGGASTKLRAQGPAVSESSSNLASNVTPVATDPNQLVLAAVRQAVWGPSIACRVQQTTKA